MTITLKPDLESRLKEAAGRLRISPAEYAQSLIDSALQRPHRATIDLLRRWQAADAPADPAELAAARAEAQAFMESLSRSRTEMEGPQARKL